MRIENSVSSIAIGSFDGIHIAHQRLIKEVEAIVVIEHSRGKLTPGFKRAWYCNKPLYIFMLSQIRQMSSKEFIDVIKRCFPNLERVVVGYDFNFGRDREGNVDSLKRILNIEVVVIDEVKYRNISVHSKTIQNALIDGHLSLANGMLNRYYRIDGYQIRGQGLGKKEFVPTINIKTKRYTLPKDGVYASLFIADNQKYKSVTFMGHRLSTDGSFAIESHILDEQFSISKYSRVFIEFVELIRENRKFDTFSELKRRIEYDIDSSRKILSNSVIPRA